MVSTGHGREPDVIVVGGGLAGLACAFGLTRGGLRVMVHEASDEVGGRMRTDRRDGFLLDRGFQVFNTAHPQVRRLLPLRRLRLRPFTPGVLAHTPSGVARLTDPTRRPREAGGLLPGRALGARDLAALAGLTARDALAPTALLKRGRDRTTAQALARGGLSRDAVDHLLRPFLAGVFLEPELETSARFFHLVWRSMARRHPLPPGPGDRQCAALPGRPAPRGHRAAGLTGPAASPTGACCSTTAPNDRPAPWSWPPTRPPRHRLPPGLDVPPGRTVTTYYHATGRSPLPEPTLVVDSTLAVLNTCVLTEVSPTYAPPGTALVSTSVLGADAPDGESAVRRRRRCCTAPTGPTGDRSPRTPSRTRSRRCGPRGR